MIGGECTCQSSWNDGWVAKDLIWFGIYRTREGMRRGINPVLIEGGGVQQLKQNISHPWKHIFHV